MHQVINRSIGQLIRIGLCVLIAGVGYANPSEKVNSIFDLLQYQEVVHMTIEIDLDSIMAGKRRQEEFKTRVSFMNEEQELLTWKTDVTIRGKFRRVHCTTPPLKLNFKKSELREAGLATYDDYKLVTYCVEDPEHARELIIKEYLIYKIFNQLTDFSYRVQMLQITYRNPETGKEDQQWGFLIEDTALLRARTETEKVRDALVMPIDTFLAEQFRLVAVFQYVIGNVDWGIAPTKNVNYVRRENKIIPVPYDFDFAALVNAPYAKAWTGIGHNPMRHITSLSALAMDEEFATTLAYIQTRRRSVLSTTRRLKILPSDPRKEVLRYLKDFFEYNQIVTSWELGR